MKVRSALRFGRVTALFAVYMATSGAAAAQDVSLNYERLSSLEEPLATEVGDVTIALTGLLDARLAVDSVDNDDDSADVLGNFELRGSTQLSNRWRLGLAYFGQYATDVGAGSDSDDAYQGNAAASLGSVWGTALVGDVSGVVREQTRRLRGVGNGFLAFDSFLGESREHAGAYVGRFGPWVASIVVDEKGDLDVGAMFQRPIGNKDWRFTARAAEGTYPAADGSNLFDANGANVVGELIYGSTTFDMGVGYERLTSHIWDAERSYVSAGVRTKTGAMSVSLEGHYGRIEDEEEISAAFGLQYDLARGLSANLGLNHASAIVSLGEIRLVDTRSTEAALSLRYSY